MTIQPVGAALEAAAKIRDHIRTKTPIRCDPMFLDAEDHWRQSRYWPDLGLARHSIGPRGKASKVKAETYWAHDLLPDTYGNIYELLAALEGDAEAPQGESANA